MAQAIKVEDDNDKIVDERKTNLICTCGREMIFLSVSEYKRLTGHQPKCDKEIEKCWEKKFNSGETLTKYNVCTNPFTKNATVISCRSIVNPGMKCPGRVLCGQHSC